METNKLREKKDQLSKDVSKLVKQFINETGFSDIEIRVTTDCYTHGDVSVLTSLNTDVIVKL